jgi:phage/plasmid-like protein (TIGR03299 family)
MAHEIMIKNGVAQYASTQREWHGLGALMQPNQPIETWARDAGMDYKVQRAYPRYAVERIEPDAVYIPAHKLRQVDDKVVLFRSDTHAPLGVVSDGYKVVQPREVLDFFREWAEAGGLTIESAGVLFGGKRYFATAKLADGVCVDGSKDKLVPYALLSTSADGSLATEGRWTTVRVVCNNTLRMAREGATAFRVTHRSEWKPEKFQAVIEQAQAEFGTFMETTRKLAAIRVESKLAEEMTVALFKKGTETDADKVRESRGFASVMSLFAGAGKGAMLETSRGTAWGWLNAVTEHVDHHVRARSDENRTASALWGPGDALKQQAVEIALAAA